MFEHFAESFAVIFVTGPQRSGTTICARMIAHDAGYRYVDEEDFSVHEMRALERVISNRRGQRLVIQCPALARWIHELGAERSSAVVWMVRDTIDVIHSQMRIGWAKEQDEKAKYADAEITLPNNVPVSLLKWYYWTNYQRYRCANPFEVEFEKLASHPLWVPKDGRASFEARQWSRE